MEAFFAFTDECGNYQKERSEKYLTTHPYYVRATVILSLNDYLILQDGMDKIKAEFKLSPDVEVKWSHFGSAIKSNYNKIPHSLSVEQLKEYYYKILSLLKELNSATIYYTITDNRSIKAVDEVKLLKMHFQNALQRVQTVMSDKEGFAMIVADDLNDKTKALKQAIYELMIAGDYVQYTNIKKGVYIDFSNQCHGLQIADICAGIFTATIKYCSAPKQEKHKYQDGYNLFVSCGCMKTRAGFQHPPRYDVYKYGVKEVPTNAGCEIAKEVSKIIEDELERDLQRILYDDDNE